MPQTTTTFLRRCQDHAVDALSFIRRKNFGEYKEDKILRAALEMAYIIIGENLMSIQRNDKAVFKKIKEGTSLIAIRESLRYGNNPMSHLAYWTYTQETLPGFFANIIKIK